VAPAIGGDSGWAAGSGRAGSRPVAFCGLPRDPVGAAQHVRLHPSRARARTDGRK